MKHILFALAILFQTSLYSQSRNLVTVEGFATEYEDPNQILINVTIDDTADKLAEAREVNQKNVATVVDFLKSKDIQERNLVTQFTDITVERSKSGNILRYTASRTINVCISKISDYDSIIDGLLALNVDHIDKPIFRTTKLSLIKEKARKKAVDDAHKKAKHLAFALNQKIGRAVIIEEVVYDFDLISEYVEKVEQSKIIADETYDFYPDKIAVKATIKVAFELK